MMCCAHAVFHSLSFCRAVGEMRYDPASWSALLGELSKYLCSIYEEADLEMGLTHIRST